MTEPALPLSVLYMQAFSVPLATLLAALAAGVVTWKLQTRHARIAEAKLKFDLFEKRYEVFIAAREFAAGVAASGKVGKHDFAIYILKTLAAHFLFGDDVVTYLNRISKTALGLTDRISDFSERLSVDDKLAAEQNHAEYLDWISDQSKKMEEIFKPYLSVDKL